jgi:hypothetical protein
MIDWYSEINFLFLSNENLNLQVEVCLVFFSYLIVIERLFGVYVSFKTF